MKKYLHIGCFDQVVAGWENVDITPHIFISWIPLLPFILNKTGMISKDRYNQHRRGLFRKVKYMNLKRRFPYPDASFQWVFSSHVLEHLFPEDAQFCLREIFRILKIGGGLRIVLPDLDKLVAGYNPKNPESFLIGIFGAYKKTGSKNFHHWHYNFNLLKSILEDIGFSKICSYGFREGECPDIEILDNRPDESFYIEAIK